MSISGHGSGAMDERSVAELILRRVQADQELWGTYSLDLTLDAMLEYYLATGDVRFRDYVLSIVDRRRIEMGASVRKVAMPFGQLDYTILRCKPDPGQERTYVQSSLAITRMVARSPDGLVLHRSGRGAARVLIDFMQDHVARLARLGLLTGEVSYFEAAADQIRKHRALLRNPDTGLWCQGSGWESEDVNRTSPGAWARGQGWVLRGLTDALLAIPADRPESGELQGYVQELLTALRLRQDAGGFFHCLVDEPARVSAPETSGTAFAAMAGYRALGWSLIDGDAWWRMADQAFWAVCGRIDEQGQVHGACAGPGPLNRRHRAHCRGQCRSTDHAHGAFTLLYACAARAVALRIRARLMAGASRG